MLIEVIRSGGHSCEFFRGNISIADTVRKLKPDLSFNICESHFGDMREAQVLVILGKIQIPYTSSPVLCLALALDKLMTKRVLSYHDLPTPDFRPSNGLINRWMKPYILEINPLPGPSPEIPDIVIKLAVEGMGYTELVNLILQTALQGFGMLDQN